MKSKILLSYVLFLLSCSPVIAQLTEREQDLTDPTSGLSYDRHYILDFNLRGLGSTQENLPFWFYQNQRGRVSENSNLSAWISGKAVHFITPNSFLLVGAGVLYDDGTSEEAVSDELFVHFQNSWMYLTAGQKHRPELYNGLSASNESILWSLNARPLPGLQGGTTAPFFLFSDEGFGFEGSWNDYWMGKQRHVEGARVHHKFLRLVYRTGEWQVKAGLQHFVQWGGISPTHGVQPESFDDYLRVITGREGGANAIEGDQQNTLGNHLGGYEFYLRREFSNFDLEFFYNHIFEDGSGRRLGNTPDGRYAIFYQDHDEDKLINAIMYEYYTTEHQSHTTSGIHNNDDYFNNSVYRSGWTYRDRVLGAPFFTKRPDGPGIINNKFNAHHIGIGGRYSDYFHTYPFKLLLSYARNDGRYVRRYRPEKQDVFYGLFDLRLLRRMLDVNIQIGVELDSYTAPTYGAGVHLSYRL